MAPRQEIARFGRRGAAVRVLVEPRGRHHLVRVAWWQDGVRRYHSWRDSEAARAEAIAYATTIAERLAPSVSSVPAGQFPVIVDGARRGVLTRVIYGLLDPREPARIRYVGQAAEPFTRYGGHVAEAVRESTCPLSRKAVWIRDLLLVHGVAPTMVLLEQVAPHFDLSVRERRWMLDLQQQGQADLNGHRRSVLVALPTREGR